MLEAGLYFVGDIRDAVSKSHWKSITKLSEGKEDKSFIYYGYNCSVYKAPLGLYLDRFTGKHFENVKGYVGCLPLALVQRLHNPFYLKVLAEDKYVIDYPGFFYTYIEGKELLFGDMTYELVNLTN